MERQILVPLDGSSCAEAALPHALHLARASGSALHLLRVVLSPLAVSPLAWPMPVTLDTERMIRADHAAAHRYLDELKFTLKWADVPISTMVVEGEPSHCIVTLAQENPIIGSIVMVSQGHSRLHRWALGSVTERVLHATPVPLLVVPSDSAKEITLTEAMPGYGRILVPLDGSPFAEQALGLARVLADYNQAKLELLSVVPYLDAHELAEGGVVPMWSITEQHAAREHALNYLENTALQLTKAGLRVQSSTIEGQPAETIVLAATNENVDLIVMSTHGRSGLRRLWLGSVATAVIRQAPMPVLLVRSDPEPPNHTL